MQVSFNTVIECQFSLNKPKLNNFCTTKLRENVHNFGVRKIVNIFIKNFENFIILEKFA